MIINDLYNNKKQGVAEGSLNEGQYEMMMRNGQVKKFIAKDDADAKRIAAGHGAKSVIKLRGGVPAGKVSEQGVAEGYYKDPDGDDESEEDKEDKKDNEKRRREEDGVAEGENFATFEDIHSLTKLAGIPVAESRLMDATGETIDHILNRFKHEVRNFETTGDLDDDLYHALYDYYSDNGDMPYGTMKARTGDPYEWVSDRFAKELSIDEGVLGTVGGAMLGSVMGGPVGAAVGGVAGQEMTKGGSGIVESSCNQTMEGEYCPEHGLAECGGMAAPTNAFAESRESDVLLARIKALALIR